MAPFFGTGFERDEVDRVTESLSFLLLDVEEFVFGFCLSESSGLLDRKERLSAGMACRIEQA